MRRRPTLILVSVIVLLAAAIPLASRIYNASALKYRRQWKTVAIAEIEKLAADGPWISQQADLIRKQMKDAGWATDRVALMADGQWIIFRQQCVKEDRRLGDIFIGKASNGKWYYSSYHFCIGMLAAKMDQQPKDLPSFISTYYVREFDGKSDEALAKTWPVE